VRRSVLPLVVFLVVGGGVAAGMTHAAPFSKSCERSGVEFRLCQTYRGPGRAQYPTIERRSRSGWKVVIGPLRHGLEAFGMWGAAFKSPDGRTLLAEWGYACDGHVAIFIPLKSRVPRVVTGERDWRKARGDQQPLGWTRDGKARVRIGQHVRLFDPAHRLTPQHRAASGC
jgi:hypothetical protein